MADEKRDSGYSFWALVLSSAIGTAAGYFLAHYTANRRWNADGYVDKAIRFLEDVKSKSQRSYDSERKDI